jgi:hypothetical protein
MNTIVRVEHRFDDSTGIGGGFFKNGEIRPGVAGLSPGQHLLLLGLLMNFASPYLGERRRRPLHPEL